MSGLRTFDPSLVSFAFADLHILEAHRYCCATRYYNGPVRCLNMPAISKDDAAALASFNFGFNRVIV